MVYDAGENDSLRRGNWDEIDYSRLVDFGGLYRSVCCSMATAVELVLLCFMSAEIEASVHGLHGKGYKSRDKAMAGIE
jgi:hypothetical protein